MSFSGSGSGSGSGTGSVSGSGWTTGSVTSGSGSASAESQKVFFRDSVQEIHIVLGALTVNDQIKDILAGGGDVKNSLPSSSVALSTTVPVPSGVKGLVVVSVGDRRLGFRCGLVTLGVGRDAHTGKENRAAVKTAPCDARYSPLLHRASGPNLFFMFGILLCFHQTSPGPTWPEAVMAGITEKSGQLGGGQFQGADSLNDHAVFFLLTLFLQIPDFGLPFGFSLLTGPSTALCRFFQVWSWIAPF